MKDENHFEETLQKRKGVLEVGETNPCEGMSPEEIENLLEMMTKEGFIEKTPEGGFQLTKKGIQQAKRGIRQEKKQKLKELFHI